ncbi:MAG: AAA family ATPase [Candidatus Heimdallarchaeaceae archaeon]
MSENTRPQRIKDFLGQKSTVEKVNIASLAVKRRDLPFPHMIMGGPPGLGKTTLAQIIANEMEGTLISRIATAISTPEDLYNLFKSITELNTIIFIDEIEQLDRKMTELLHTAMEDFTFSTKLKNGKLVNTEIPEFTLMGATNYLGELPRPFLDRFKIQVNFECYSEEEISEILIGVTKKMKVKATEEGVRAIAERSRGVPRVAIRYFDSALNLAFAYHKEFKEVISTRCVKRMFEVEEIDFLGLTDLDRKILQYLKFANKPVGLKTISQGVNEDDSTIEFSESYLVRTRMLTKTTKGRVITDEGKRHLEEVKI